MYLWLISLILFQNYDVLASRQSHWFSTSMQDDHRSFNEHGFPYWNYLLAPRLHFTGKFLADVSTVNNYVDSFDTENYSPHDDDIQGFNPYGTGAWSVFGRVTRVCYFNGSCGNRDPIVDASFEEDSNKTSAKIVDLDAQAQLYSEMWGWRIRIGDHFSADYTPVPLQYMWGKKPSALGDGKYAAAYQSTLTNIRWINHRSPFVKELQQLMGHDNIDSEKLSIRFNLDMIDQQQYGRIVGSIGLHGTKSPPFYSQGRWLKSLSPIVEDTPFMVDERNHKVILDFGNTFQINHTGHPDVGNRNIYVAVSLDDYSPVTCHSNLFWLGVVLYHNPKWYTHSSGIQSVPSLGSLSDDEVDTIKNHPLAVIEVKGAWPSIRCKTVLLAEAEHGTFIRPYSKWSTRINVPEKAEFQVFATKFGRPLKNAVVRFEPGCSGIPGLKVCYPPMPYLTSTTTDQDGIATFAVQTKDPKSPRKHLDGQLYVYVFYIEGLKPDYKNMSANYAYYVNNVLTLRIFDHYVPHSPPTWLDDVYPIFLQYANLYPVMTRNFVDLGNYYDVLKQKKIILMSMELPITDPNYMPVTRDLSDSKRKMIIEWLSQDKPAIGKAKDFYTLENLRKNLQTALQIEMATIPPYMTALATIKHNYNHDVKSILKTILNQEMIHMTLVANILNAVGGEPKLYSKKVVPKFPTRLPGGVHPELVVPIEKLSIDLIRNVFMKIEEPENGLHRHLEFQYTFDFVEQMKDTKTTSHGKRHRRSLIPDPGVDEEDFLPCLGESFKNHLHKDLSEVPNDRRIPGNGLFEEEKRSKKRFPSAGNEFGEKHHHTIGGFYKHILNMLCYLTECGRNNSIFTGDPDRQVEYVHGSLHGKSFKVTDFYSAIQAIKTIIEQGEGSSLCNPMFWSNGSVSDLSHYYLFHSIIEKRQIVVMDERQDKRDNVPTNDGVGYEDFFKFCGGKYSFKGPRIDFDPNGIWPMIPNPRLSKFKKGSPAYIKASEFNTVHNRLLKSLDHIFNGHPDDLKDSIGLMYSLQVHLKKLVRVPVHQDGDPDVGPNAGPSFH